MTPLGAPQSVHLCMFTALGLNESFSSVGVIQFYKAIMPRLFSFLFLSRLRLLPKKKELEIKDTL